MLEFNEKILMEKIVLPVFSNLIKYETYNNSKEIEISLPFFFNTGDTLDVIVEKRENSIVLKNLSHRLIEQSLSDKIDFISLRKKYFFGKKTKIEEAQKIYLDSNGIKNTLLQEKIISFGTEEEIKEAFFSYCFYILRYYNFVHDYFLVNLSERIGNHFENEIYNFIETYNKSQNIQLKEIEKNETNIISQNNKYFYDNEIVLTGINTKINFCEAVLDIENIKKEMKVSKFVVVYQSKNKNDLNRTYMEKIFKVKKIGKIEFKDLGAGEANGI